MISENTQIITPKLIVIDMESDATPNSFKEIVEKIFIIPTVIIAFKIIKGIDNNIAIHTLLGPSLESSRY